MLKRNLAVKLALQHWQDNVADGYFDLQEKVFDMLIEEIHNRDEALMKTVLVMNLEVKDNHEEASIGGGWLGLDPCQEIEAAESWDLSCFEIKNPFSLSD